MVVDVLFDKDQIKFKIPESYSQYGGGVFEGKIDSKELSGTFTFRGVRGDKEILIRGVNLLQSPGKTHQRKWRPKRPSRARRRTSGATCSALARRGGARLSDARSVAKRDIARRVLPGLQQLERHALRYALEQPSAIAEEDRADDELILID